VTVAPATRDGASPVRISVRVRAADAEAALARLLDAFPAGLEERAAGADVEYVVYGEALPELPGVVEVRSEPVPDGWETAYHAHLTRVIAGPWAVRPPWVAGEDADLVIDPGTAFGAGTHPTTRLCLELLAESAPASGLADWGAGTGVLAIAAARLGFSPVLAVDVAAIDGIASNAAANAVGVEAVALDLTRERAPYAPTVVANLTLPLLRAVARVQERPERLIASGVLARQADGVAAAWGMVERERRELDGWAAVVLG
jgi:ribosomal protein L11 methyltransferase